MEEFARPAGRVVHVVYASDDGFAEILGVSLRSLLMSKGGDAVALHILSDGISPENMRRIEAVCAEFGQGAPEWIDVRKLSRALAGRVAPDRGSASQFSRLFVGSLLAPEVERCIYLDCDTLVLRPIGALWRVDLAGCTVGALAEAFSARYRANLGLPPDAELFNSGVLLIDLARWRALGAEEALLRFIASRNGSVRQGDQGALNAALPGGVRFLEPRFNALSYFFDLDYRDMLRMRRPPRYRYSKEQVESAAREPAIVHFTTSLLSLRPWVEGSRHPFAAEWLRVRAGTPWAGEPLRADERPGWKRRLAALPGRLPRGAGCALLGIAHAYVRPLLWRLRDGGAL